MINKITGHFEEKDGDKYLIISPKNDDTIQKYQEIFDRLKEIIKKINDYSQPIKYDDNYVKIKFNTDDNIPLDNISTYYNNNHQECHKKDDKYYLQIFLNECLYQVYKCHNMIE